MSKKILIFCLLVIVCVRIWLVCDRSLSEEINNVSGRLMVNPVIKINKYNGMEQQVFWIKSEGFPFYSILPIETRLSLGDEIYFSAEITPLSEHLFCPRYLAIFDNTVMEISNSNNIYSYIDWVRVMMISNIEDNFSFLRGGILRALTFGDENGLSDKVISVFQEAGLIHILVVSGYNISLIVRFTMNFTKIWFGNPYSSIVGLVSLIIYVMMVGFNPPAVRAGLLVGLVILGEVLGRPRNIKYLYLVTVLMMLLYDPYWLTDISWQLSVMATGALIFPVIKFDYFHKKMEIRVLLGKFFGMLLENFISSINVALWVMPILMLHFGEVSFITVISTPAVSWILLPITILGIVISVLGGFVWQPLVMVISLTTECLIFILYELVKFFSYLNLEIPISMNYYWFIIYYLLLFLIYKLSVLIYEK